MTLRVKVRIEPRAAIMARKAIAGDASVDVTEGDLASIPEGTLARLAEVLESGETLEGPGVIDASFASVLAGLEARAARIQEAADRRAREEAERRAAAGRAAEEELDRKRRGAREEAERQAAITTWVEANCTEEMADRRRAGVLSEDEVIEEAVHQLFEITEDEHVQIQKTEACDCDLGCTGSVLFHTLLAEHLDSAQFAALQRIKEAAPKGAVVTAQARKAVCPACTCTPLVRMVALVQLAWNGWMLQKAYALR